MSIWDKSKNNIFRDVVTVAKMSLKHLVWGQNPVPKPTASYSRPPLLKVADLPQKSEQGPLV